MLCVAEVTADLIIGRALECTSYANAESTALRLIERRGVEITPTLRRALTLDNCYIAPSGQWSVCIFSPE